MLLAAAGILACTGATATAQGKCSDIVVSGVYCSVDIAIADHALPASRVDLLAPGIARPLAFAAAPV
ncbi:hypothetical protein ACPWML_25685, partial [Pandoraea pneumonica]